MAKKPAEMAAAVQAAALNAAELRAELAAVGDAEKASQMRAYMRDKFSFFGVPSPQRKMFARQRLPKHKKNQAIDWNFVSQAWAAPEREMQYLALAYLERNASLLRPEHLDQLKSLVVEKSWWDSIDSITHLVGTITLRSPETKAIVRAWSKDDNFWVRRTAIEHQLKHKDRTDQELLAETILNNLGSNEFFINKAIGWALREYSKTNPVWVRAFIETHRGQLSNLSIREGGKYC